MVWKKRLKQIGDLILTIFVIGIVFLTTIIITSKITGNEVSVAGYQLKIVLSGSMEPAIETGSIIIIKQTDAEHSYAEGDVITFTTKDNVPVTHRIVEAKENEYITQGDNNGGIDFDPVLPQNIVGKYTGVTIPYIGYVMNVANSKLGSALMLIIPGLYLIGYAVFTIARSFKQIESSNR